jgi:hypothetical protein
MCGVLAVDEFNINYRYPVNNLDVWGVECIPLSPSTKNTTIWQLN